MEINGKPLVYILENGEQGSIDDLKNLSKDELKSQINKFIDQYIWLFSAFDYDNKLSRHSHFYLKTPDNSVFWDFLKEIYGADIIFFEKHKSIIKQYVEHYFAENKKINPIKLLTHLEKDNINIFFSYNFAKNDFSKILNFQEKIKQLIEYNIISDEKIYSNCNSSFSFIKKHCVSRLHFHQHTYFHKNSHYSEIIHVLIHLNNFLRSFYYTYYFNEHLAEHFSKSFYDNDIQLMLSFNSPTDLNGLSKTILNETVLAFYKYLTTLDNKLVSNNFVQIIKFLFYFDNQSVIKRKEFSYLLIKYASTNLLEDSISFLNNAEKIFTPAKFKIVKDIINNNCQQYKLSSLYQIQQKPFFMYDIIFPKNNINIIFNEINILNFLNNYMFIENVDDTYRLRLLFTEEITLSSSEVINTLQQNLKEGIRKSRRKPSSSDIDDVVHKTLRLICINNSLSKNPEEKKDSVRKKL